MPVDHMCAWCLRGHKRVSHLLKLELWVVMRHYVCVLGLDPGPLEGQSVLLTTNLSLQPAEDPI